MFDLQEQVARVTKACGALLSDMTAMATRVEEIDNRGPVVGPEGPEGQPGPAGASGEPGLCGERGLQGTAGPQGTDGERGPRGDLGPAGVTGAQGDQGGRGTMGVKGNGGAKGSKGDKGDMGKRGPKGDRGAGVTGARLKGRDLILDIDGKPHRVGAVVAKAIQMAQVFGGGGGSSASSAVSARTISASMPTVKLSGKKYAKGFYDFQTAASTFDVGTPWGQEDISYAAHLAFISDAGAGGGVDTVLEVVGTRIQDTGVRTEDYTATVTIAHDVASGTYQETPEKFLGQVIITRISGPALNCNYGWTAYWDSGNTDFRIVGVGGEWNGNASDSGLNVRLLHHRMDGWVFNAVAAPGIPPAVVDLKLLHGIESNLGAAEHGRMKVVPLAIDIEGSGSEGVLWEVTTGVVNSLNYGTLDFSVVQTEV